MKNDPNNNKDLIWKNKPCPDHKGDRKALHAYFEAYDENIKKLEALDAKAQKRGCMQGRVLYERFADGHAIYQVVKENKKTCRIRQVSVGGDDWTIPYWGSEATVDKGFVINRITALSERVFVDGYGQKWE